MLATRYSLLHRSHVEILAKVKLAGLGVVDEELAGALGQHLAPVDEVGAVDGAQLAREFQAVDDGRAGKQADVLGTQVAVALDDGGSTQ